MKPEQKEKMEKFVVKVDEVKKKVDEGVNRKVMPLLKGNEGVVVVVLAVMLVASLSMKAVFFGLLAAGVMLMPVYAPKIIARLSQKEEEAPKVEEATPVIEVEVIEKKDK